MVHLPSFSLNGKETISFYDASPENILLLCVKPQGVNTVQGYNLFLKKIIPLWDINWHRVRLISAENGNGNKNVAD